MSQRFPVKDESNSIDKGLAYYQGEVGEFILWYVFDTVNTVADNIYDVGRPGFGRRWKKPIRVPVLNANHIMATNMEVEPRGFYTPDRLHLVVSWQQAKLAGVPHLYPDPTILYNDRVVYHNQVFTPEAVQNRGLLLERYSTVSLDCLEVMADELVNDPDFTQYARQPDTSSGVDAGHYGSAGEYGKNMA